MPSQMRSLSRLLETKATRSQAQEELQRAQIVVVEEAKLTKIPPDITILEKIDDVTTADQKLVRPTIMMKEDGRNDGENSELKETHDDGAGRDTLSETSQAPTQYVDEFLQNINILWELIFVDKESQGGSEIANSRDSRLLDKRL